jgi:hypothetical protein
MASRQPHASWLPPPPRDALAHQTPRTLARALWLTSAPPPARHASVNPPSTPRSFAPVTASQKRLRTTPPRGRGERWACARAQGCRVHRRLHNAAWLRRRRARAAAAAPREARACCAPCPRYRAKVTRAPPPAEQAARAPAASRKRRKDGRRCGHLGAGWLTRRGARVARWTPSCNARGAAAQPPPLTRVSPRARAGNAQKTAMSRAKNQAKLDGASKGAQRARARRRACGALTSAGSAASLRAAPRQPAEAERGGADAEGASRRAQPAWPGGQRGARSTGAARAPGHGARLAPAPS